MKKILSINLTIFIVLIVILECIFGYWFKENNFGIYMRSERNRNDLVNATHNDKNYNFYYKRNFYAFRGEEVDPSTIKVVFQGGSTGNQRFTPQKYTIVGNLNDLFKNESLEIIIHNASTDGKTTRGYVNDFLHWFPKIPNFKPKFFIFYTGINDRRHKHTDKHFKHYDFKFSTKSLKKIRDYIKNNSIILEYIKKIENKYFPQLVDVYAVSKKDLYNNFTYISFDEAREKYTKIKLNTDEEIMLHTFQKRLENLKKIIIKNKFTPIFVTQIKFDGLSDRSLFIVNQELKRFCQSNNFDIILLDELVDNMVVGDFFDEVHTSISGSKKIAKILYPHLKKLINR